MTSPYTIGQVIVYYGPVRALISEGEVVEIVKIERKANGRVFAQVWPYEEYGAAFDLQGFRLTETVAQPGPYLGRPN